MEEEINLFIRFLKREKALDSFMKMTEVKSLVDLRVFLSDSSPELFILILLFGIIQKKVIISGKILVINGEFV